MYVELENDLIEMRVYDDGSFIVRPKKPHKNTFDEDLRMLKNGRLTTDEFEKKYGIKELKEKAIKQYHDLLPEIEKAVKEFETFVAFMENVI